MKYSVSDFPLLLLFSNKDEIAADSIDANVLVFGAPREELDPREITELKKWLNAGGRAMLLLGGSEDGEGRALHNFLEE